MPNETNKQQGKNPNRSVRKENKTDSPNKQISRTNKRYKTKGGKQVGTE